MACEKQKKIIMVISLLNYGGASKMFVHLANYLVSKNYDVTIYTYLGKKSINTIKKEVKVISSIEKTSNLLLRKITPVINIRKILKEEKPDIIISFLTNSNFYSCLAKLGLNIPLIISERSDPYNENSVILSIMRFFYIFSSKIIFQTKEARNYFNKILRKKSMVIPNPVTLNENISLSEKEGKYKISFVGRFDIKQKRQDIMIKAFKQVLAVRKDIDLYFYGDGPDLDSIKMLIKREKINDNVFFVGKVDNVLEHIKDSTLFVLTSDYEGIPNSLMEAMSIGLPVISTDCSPGGAKLLIQNNWNGILIPKGDIYALSESIIYLLDNPTIRKEMGYNAKQINIKFENNKIMKKWEKEIEYLLSIN